MFGGWCLPRASKPSAGGWEAVASRGLQNRLRGAARRPGWVRFPSIPATLGSELAGPAPYETPYLTPHLTPPPELITSRHPIAFGEGSDSAPESGYIKRPSPRDQPEGPKRSWR